MAEATAPVTLLPEIVAFVKAPLILLAVIPVGMSVLVSARRVVDNVGVEALKSSVPVTAPVTLILGLLVMPDHATASAVAALPVISVLFLV